MSELAGLKLLRRLEEGVAGKTGEAFFQQIVYEIARALDAQGAFTSRLIPERRARMLAFWMRDGYQPLTTYSLAGTPCEYVYDGQVTAYARNVGEIFPVDKEWFEQLGVKSYLGIPVRDETDRPIGHLAVMDTRERDWHEADVDVLRLFGLRTAAELHRSRYQQELEESNRRLQTEVEHRIATERELAAAKMAAEAANQAKSVFISQMSHELRTPLNGILGYTQLLKQDAALLSARQLDGLDTIERSGEHLLNLVNDLLDLAKIEAGKLELHAEDVDLHELLRHVADLAAVRAGHAGLQFDYQMADVSSHVQVDARALRQVLLNLLGNAVKFTPRGGQVALRVDSAHAGESSGRYRFRVSDTGVGIDAQQLPRIFEPFHRAVESGRIIEGTGLGLAITQRLVHEMAGSIAVSSEVGSGSVFVVELPLAPAQRPAEAITAASSICGYKGEVRSAIVADDDETNRSLVSHLLEGVGFTVRRATNGLEALQLFRAQSADIVISDLVMPVVDGIELTKVLRSQPNADVPIIVLSASASPATRQEVLEAGCTAFVTKPIRLPQLLEEVGKALGLDWIEAGPMTQRAFAPEVLQNANIDISIARDLYDLALQGDVMALLAKAQICLADVSTQTLYAEIKSLADQYDMSGLRRILGAYCR